LAAWAPARANGGRYVRLPEAIGREVEMLRLYDFHESGNAFKVRLPLALVRRPVERIEMHILEGETRTF
jgi:hypothetical protein